jgi:hypothetical protein
MNSKASKAKKAVILASDELEAAESDFDLNDAASCRRLYVGLSAACSAYAHQYYAVSAKAHEPFPLMAAEKLHLLLEELLAGNLSPIARRLVKRSGARGRTVLEKAEIYVACQYMQAVEEKWIADRSPVLRVATRYGVDRATAQSWRRNEKRDLLPDLDGGDREVFAKLLTEAMESRGDQMRKRTARKS